MAHQRAEPRVLALSTRVYQTLLAVYPPRFRQEYEPHMLQVFRDYCRRAVDVGGNAGVARLWAITMFDLIGSLIEQHTSKETHMTQGKFIRLSGWALMLAGVTLMLFMGAAETVPNNWGLGAAFMLTSSVLLGAGMLGLRAAYRREAGGLGSSLLLIGAILGQLSFLVFAPGFFEFWDGGWILIYGSPGFALAFLAAFGVVCVRRGVMPGANKLAILAGVWFAPLVLVAILLESSAHYEYMTLRGAMQPITWLAFVVQMVALVALGYNLQRTESLQPTTA